MAGPRKTEAASPKAAGRTPKATKAAAASAAGGNQLKITAAFAGVQGRRTKAMPPLLHQLNRRLQRVCACRSSFFQFPGETASPAKAAPASPAKASQSPTRRSAAAVAAAEGEAPTLASPVKAEDAKAADNATPAEEKAAAAPKKKAPAKPKAKAADAENAAAPRLRFITAEEETALVVRSAAPATPANGCVVNMDAADARAIASRVRRSSSRRAGSAGCASARSRRPR